MSKKRVILFLSVIFVVMLSMTAVFSSAYLTDMDKKDSIILKSAKLKNEITVELLQNHIDNGASTAVMTCTLKNQSNIDITNSIQLEAGFQMSNDGNKYNDKITALYVYPGSMSDNAIISDINNGALNAYSRVVSAGKAKITLPDVVIEKDSEKDLSFKLALDTDDLCGYGNILNIDIAAEAKTKNSGGGVGFTENLGTKSLTLYDNINTSDANNTIVNGIQTIRAVKISGTYGVISTEAAPLANLYQVLPIREKNKVSIADDNTHFSGYGLTIKNGKLYGTPSTAADVSFTDAVTFCYSGDTKKIGYAYLNLVIEPYDISNENIEVAALESFVYTGSAITPSTTVKNKNMNKNLVLNEDYTLSYSDNVNVGAGTIKISGKGNYKGQISKTFDISAQDIAETTISKIDDYIYAGNVIQPTPTITYNGKTLVKDTDYTLSYSNNTNAGTATVTISGKGNFDGTTSKTFTINKRAISSATVGTISSYTYDGNAKTPTPTITYNGKTLVKDTDYTLSYSNNTNAGTATVTILGKGNFDGTTSKTFTINKRAISSASVGTISAHTYDGNAKTPMPVITYNGKTLVKDTDYTLSYSDNTNAGTATVTISGKGNFDGSTSKTFTINKANASVSSTPAANTLTYTGNAQTLVTSGTAIGGTMYYKLGSGGTYSTTRPTATDVNTYTVYYYVKGDSNHYDTSASSLSVTISKASQSAPTTLTANVDSLTQVTLSASGNGKTALEYSKDGTNWQSSNVFSELTTEEEYVFYARYKSNNNYFQSDYISESGICSCFTWNGTTITGLSSFGTDLTSIVIPSRATAIARYAFKENDKITNLEIGENVTTIGNEAFYKCLGLSGNLIVPDSVTSIGNLAFFRCGFNKLTLSKNLISIGNDCFFLCNTLTGDLTIPNGVTSIGNRAFTGCSGFNGVATIPSSVTSIGENAFLACSNFTAINIYNTEGSISGAPWGALENLIHWLGVSLSSAEEFQPFVNANMANNNKIPAATPALDGSPTPSILPTFEPTSTPTPSILPTLEPTLTPAPSSTPTPSILPTLEPTLTPAPSSTPTPSISPALEPTLTPAPSSTPTPSILPALEPTLTPAPSSTPTPSISPTLEPTVTPVSDGSPTPSILPTLEPTLAPAPSSTLIPTAIIKEMDKESKTQVWVLSISVRNTVLDRILKEI